MKIWLAGLTLTAVIALVYVNISAVEPPGIFVFTDSMVYGRPALVTVFGVVLDYEGNPVTNIALTVEVIDPNGDTVFNAEVATGSDGKFLTSFSISSEVPEGRYTVVVQALEGTYWPAETTFQVCEICITNTQQTNNYITVTTTATYTSEITRTQTIYLTTTTGTTSTTVSTTTISAIETTTIKITLERDTYTTIVKTTQTVTTSIGGTSTVTLLNEKTTTITVKENPSQGTNVLLYIGITIIAVLSITSYYAIRHFKPNE